ncbi:MAG: uncharacterized protein KVP18_001253 [Porospora cf. gigantea A]|uniref:uncharacterized protein n=1 Tax=Porospora cf. gigantea A TaxID=2853593 RepID=UPI00355A2306|nr:MAG: hypothetical protein KVP18_001253 [Porospora cf. gigantea A]
MLCPLTIPSADFEVGVSDILDVALEAGVIIESAFYQPESDKGTSCKFSSSDLVTVTDTAVETYLGKTITERWPGHLLYGEETSSSRLPMGPVWVVDPIDGTSNFVHAFPLCCTSIAFLRDKQVLLGVVYNPILVRTLRRLARRKKCLLPRKGMVPGLAVEAASGNGQRFGLPPL